MPDPLVETFREDLGCSLEDAASLASHARSWIRTVVPGLEDDDADLIVRLRDPRVFGPFAASCLRSRSLRGSTRLSLASHVFDLVPLPTSELRAFDPRSRVPENLIELAAWIASRGEFTPLHFLHLLYAAFLDRDIVRRSSMAARSAMLRASLIAPELEPSSRTLYALLHLSAVPDAEAAREFRWILRSRSVPREVQRPLAHGASSPGAASRAFLEAARDQMLVPEDARGDDPSILAMTPTLSARLEGIARAWLDRTA